MVESGNAIALMGNHEYNAICYNTLDKQNGGYLRKHNIKNTNQHVKTLNDFLNRQSEYYEYINWFKTLPLFYEKETFSAVHACWDDATIQLPKQHLKENRLTEQAI
jgi:hypothetical protein